MRRAASVASGALRRTFLGGWRRTGLTAALAAMVASVVVAGPAAASFARSQSAATPVSSATLESASDLSVSTACDTLLSLTAKATLSWTATPSTFASGYEVERWKGSILESTGTVTPRTTTSVTQTGLATGTTYTWKVRAFVSSWTSTEVSVSAATPGLCL